MVGLLSSFFPARSRKGQPCMLRKTQLGPFKRLDFEGSQHVWWRWISSKPLVHSNGHSQDNFTLPATRLLRPPPSLVLIASNGNNPEGGTGGEASLPPGRGQTSGHGEIGGIRCNMEKQITSCAKRTWTFSRSFGVMFVSFVRTFPPG